MAPANFSPWPSVFALAVVLAIVVGLAYLLKRARLPGLTSALPMRTVGGLNLGARERLVVVEIGDQWHVLGVTAQSITAITQLPRQAAPATEDGTPPENFMAQLAARLKR